jgi:hypothetical protein
MKRILLLLTIYFTCIFAQAQKINKKLLIGKWEIYSFSTFGHPMCRDSIARNIQSAMAIEKELDPRYTPDDSSENGNRLKVWLANFFKTYMTFDKDGNTTAQVAVGYNSGSTDPPLETGKYEWSGENKITEMMGTSHPEVLIILDLTAAKLVVKLEGTDENKDSKITFTRAK